MQLTGFTDGSMRYCPMLLFGGSSLRKITHCPAVGFLTSETWHPGAFQPLRAGVGSSTRANSRPCYKGNEIQFDKPSSAGLV
jgi:hypothetical protein